MEEDGEDCDLKDMPDYEREHLVVQRRCAVTAFDMKVRVMRDGRERGLWIGLQDRSIARHNTFTNWLTHALERFNADFTADAPPLKRRTAEVLLREDVMRLCKSVVDEMALLEWDQLAAVHKAIGAELKKRKEGR